jgi:hypothetical protein
LCNSEKLFNCYTYNINGNIDQSKKTITNAKKSTVFYGTLKKTIKISHDTKAQRKGHPRSDEEEILES